jgi:NAD(P)-dependent dehydrogenase (short-subunit alcohol dehydrogenase family)
MAEQPLRDRLVLVTGAARRIGRAIALAVAKAGGNVIVHYRLSATGAEQTKNDIIALGRQAWTVQADLAKPADISKLINAATQAGVLTGLVNNASVFERMSPTQTSLAEWEKHLDVNLTAPFLLCQAFSNLVPEGQRGSIVNILDWRAERPGADHFPYVISKAALAAMTKSLAVALAPDITVNGLALGAILPPDKEPPTPGILDSVPAGRWGDLSEVQDTVVFLLGGPAYLTGEILRLDGGRHLL